MNNSERIIRFFCPIDFSKYRKEDFEKEFNLKIEEINSVNNLKIAICHIDSCYKKETLENYLSSASYLPPWVCFPDIESVSIFFRQGIGQDYIEHWCGIVRKRGPKYLLKITNNFPPNQDWSEYIDFRFRGL